MTSDVYPTLQIVEQGGGHSTNGSRRCLYSDCVQDGLCVLTLVRISKREPRAGYG